MNNKSNNNKTFARTCSKLSQFLKERRSLGDQTSFVLPHMPPSSSKLDSKRAEEEYGTKKNICSLFPNMEREGNVSAENFKSLNLFPLTSRPSAEESPKNNKKLRELSSPMMKPKRHASMTIFYAGKVLVFNELSEDKAQEILSLAWLGTLKNTHPQTRVQTQTQHQTLSIPPNSEAMTNQENRNSDPQEPGNSSDLPIARRTSLYRFMEKRKDRTTSALPYPLRNVSMAMANNSRPHRYNVVVGNLCQQQEEQRGQQPEFKL